MERKRKRQPLVTSAARTVLADGVQISNLTPVQSLTGGELFPIVQNNETRHATVEQIKALIPEGKPGESAYQTWLDAGHLGSEEDFLKWLQASAPVSIDPLSSNILKNNTDGLYVNGAHPIIPKFSFISHTGLLNKPYSLAEGVVIYTLSIDLPNPLNMASLDGVSLYRDFSFEPEYYYFDEQNSYVHYQIFVGGSKVTAESVALTIKVIMSGAPKRAFSLSSGEEITVNDGQDIRFPVSVHMLIGTSLEQNNMG